MSLLGATVGDIWSTGAFSFESPLKDLLDGGEYTLEQLLAEDELLQELRGLHPKLLEFFSTEEAVTKLVEYVISPVPLTTAPSSPSSVDSSSSSPLNHSHKPQDQYQNHHPDFRSIRFPYMACEVICCELSCVIDTLVDGHVKPAPTSRDAGSKQPQQQQQHHIINEHDSVEVIEENSNNNNSSSSSGMRILDLLFGLVYDTTTASPLDDYRAGYFEKVLRVLFKKRPDDLIAYVNSGGSRGKSALQQAMLSHLYSYSMMQIVQRLLLPHRPTPKKQQQQQQQQPKQQQRQLEDQDDHANNNNNKDSLVLLEGTDDDDEDDDDIMKGCEDEEEDPHAGEIKSDWSKSPAALELLIDHLLLGGGTSSSPDNTNSSEEEERRLDLSLNAAEVLITMIQNSMLSSTTMLKLTTRQVMERLVRATSLSPDDYFSPHESSLTAALSVLESLILQLGGYGAVGTMSVLNDVVCNNPESSALLQEAQLADVDEDDLEFTTSLSSTNTNMDWNQHSSVKIADLTALVECLPMLLDNLSQLLQHPSCQEWKTVTQVSKDVPQPILGSSRLRVVRVLESLVLLGDPEVDARLVQSDCLEVCLNLFWDFQWCSMLHQSVANLLVHVLEGQNLRVEMQEYFLIRCNLLVRLMDSFVDPSASAATATAASSVDSRPAQLVTNMKDGEEDVLVRTTSSTDQPLPVSEDDVDAALEKQQEADDAEATAATIATSSEKNTAGNSTAEAVAAEPAAYGEVFSTEAVQYGSSRDAPVKGVLGAPLPQSFRYGYMGHVIIICQALVHACCPFEDPTVTVCGEFSMAASSALTPRQVDDSPGGDQLPEAHAYESGNSTLGNIIASGTPRKVESRGDESSAFSKEPLFLAEMVACHPLSDKWNEFVATTLASETAIQSTPLGGYNATAIGDGMHMHRPGLADEADELGLEPPSRMGDVLDMDDNDLEIAASMMAGLAVSARAHLDDDDDEAGSGHSGDSNRSYNSGETNNSGGYFFDDPLGRLNGGLGIELGKLTKYNPEKDNPDDLLKDDDDGDDNSSSSHSSRSSDHSSSSEELGRRESDSDVPVMDLFAGNFDFHGPPASSSNTNGTPAVQDWSNFANFDDAFAAVAQPTETAPTADDDDDFRPFAEASSVGPYSEAVIATLVESPKPSNTDLDDLFGPGDHASLLAAASDEASPEFDRTRPSLSPIASSEEKDPASSEQEDFSSLLGTSESSPIAAQVVPISSNAEVMPPAGEGAVDAISPSANEDPANDHDAEIVAAPSDELSADFTAKLSPTAGPTSSTVKAAEPTAIEETEQEPAIS